MAKPCTSPLRKKPVYPGSVVNSFVMKTRTLTLFTWTLLAIALLLILGVPWANKYIPYTHTFGHPVDVWQVDTRNDPHYQYRYTIMIIGFVLSTLAIPPLLVSYFNKKENTDSKLLNT